MAVTNLVWEFSINSVDLTSYVLEDTSIEISRANTEGNTAVIVLPDILFDSYTFENGQVVTIKRGVSSADTYIFRGKIVDLKDDDNNTFRLICKDYLYELKNLLFTKSYDKNIDLEAGNYSEIFKDIVENGGFSVSAIDSTYTGLVSDKFISRQDYRGIKMEVIARILNWYYKVDYQNDWIRLEPKGYTSYGTTLTVGDNIINVPKWEHNLVPMRNKITVNGAKDAGVREETFNGDGITKDFNLNYSPESTEVTVGGTLQILGVDGSTETYDYTVDKTLNRISFETPPTTGTGNIVVKYVSLIPRPVTGFRQDSFDTYGVWQEDSYNFDDVYTISDARDRLNQLLNLLGDGEINTTILTTEYNVEVGQNIDIIDTYNTSKNGEYVVFKKIINYPQPIDTLVIGNQRFSLSDLFSSIRERIKALEKDDPDLTEILLHLIPFAYTFDYDFQSFTKVQSKVCDSYIAAHTYTDVAGIGGILDDFEDSTNWTAGSNISLSDELTITLNDVQTTKIVWSGGEDIGNISQTILSRDLSDYSGETSGLPSQGTIGVWLYIETNDSLNVNNLTLRIGNDSSNYLELDAVAYKSVDGYHNFDNLTFELQDGWNYLLFKLPNGSITGTVDWTTIDYLSLYFDFQTNLNIYLGLLTISESDYIGAVCVGSRKMVIA